MFKDFGFESNGGIIRNISLSFLSLSISLSNWYLVFPNVSFIRLLFVLREIKKIFTNLIHGNAQYDSHFRGYLV